MTENAVATRNPTPAERFSNMVLRQYAGDVGHVEMNENERMLLQHFFIKCDMAFKEANARKKNDLPPIEWAKINMTKLATDAVHRIKLGIDGLIPGHLYPIAYYNKETGLYDVDPRIGYVGEIYYKQKASYYPIHDIRIELVHETDEFTVYKQDMNNLVEGYTFKVNNPFNRGKVVGGFAYIDFEDTTRNLLFIMSAAEINKRGTGSDFWKKWEQEMQYKTLVHAAMKKIQLDPEKINMEAAGAVEIDEETEYAPETPNANSQVISAEQVFSQPTALPPKQEAVPLAPEGFTVNQAAPAPAQDKAPASRPSTPAQVAYDEVPDFLRDMGGGSKGKKDPF